MTDPTDSGQLATAGSDALGSTAPGQDALGSDALGSDALGSVRARIENSKAERPHEQMKAAAERTVSTAVATGACMWLKDSINAKNLSVICEVLQPNMLGEDYLELASDYEWADAAGIVFPTDPYSLDGSDSLFLNVRDEVSVPLVRRDTIIDPYQIYESKYLGADAVVLEADLLDAATLGEFLTLCKELYMDAVVEAHDAEGLARTIESGAEIIGVDFPAFKSIVGEMSVAAPGAPLVPEGRLLVVGPGISSMDDAKFARERGADAVLVGRLFMDIADSDERQDTIRSMTEID